MSKTCSGVRRLLQLHLSSALVLMCMSGCILWVNSIANFNQHSFAEIYSHTLREERRQRINELAYNGFRGYGWPWTAIETQRFEVFYPDDKSKRVIEIESDDGDKQVVQWLPRGILADLSVALLMLTTSAVLSEFIIRHRSDSRHKALLEPMVST